jgi:hypothetical protein
VVLRPYKGELTLLDSRTAAVMAAAVAAFRSEHATTS